MPEKRVTIAQISDLHMNRKVKPAITEMLKKILSKVGPDVLVISGDVANQPVPWQMKKAAKLVREIRESCKPARVIVIPGNHDVKFWGNFGLRRLTRIPFEIYFRRLEPDDKPFWLSDSRGGWTTRAGTAARLALDALWWKGRQMREPVIVDLFPEHPEWGLALFAVNSNSLAEMMAAGKVESHDLQQLYAALEDAELPTKEEKEAARKSQKKPGRFSFCYKIAVVHHHPAPIADAPTDANARIQESFMIFYNAGRFIRELSRRSFNLVLHGHKHVAGFLRIGCDFKDERPTVLTVAAAGSASHPAPDDTRGHHLHVIEIFDDDTASLDSWFFSEAVERKEDESRVYQLDTLEDVRRRRYETFKSSRGYLTREVRRTVEITEGCYSNIHEDYYGNEVTAREGLSSVPVSLVTGRPSYLRGVTMAPGSSAFDSLTPVQSSLHEFKGEIKLSQTRMPGDGPFDYSYCYRLMNGHALTAEDFQRHYSELDAEYASITCDGAYELMTLEVNFPKNYDLNSLEFQPIAEYVPAPLAGIDDGRLDRGEGTKKHAEETQRIARHGRRVEHGYVLTCPKPVPGMMYKIRWKFRDLGEATPSELEAAADVAAAQQNLLKLAAGVARNPDDPSVRAQWDKVRLILDGLASEIQSHVIKSPEKLATSAMVFDGDSRHLKFVCTNTEPQAMPTAGFFAGEGCAGFAFEKARWILYHAETDDIGYFIREDEWSCAGLAGGLSEDPVVLASFPWIHKPSGAKRGLIVGVINVSSRYSRTALLKLVHAAQDQVAPAAKGVAPQDEVAPITKSLEALVNSFASLLLESTVSSII